MKRNSSYQWKLFSLTSLIEVICVAFCLLLFVPGFKDLFIEYLYWTDIEQVTEDFEIYRVITPTFLVYPTLMIFFCLGPFELFGRAIERHFGAFKLGYIFIILAIVCNVIQMICIMHGILYFSMFGVVFGLVGYLCILSLRKDLPDDLRLPLGFLYVVGFFTIDFFVWFGIQSFGFVGSTFVGMYIGYLDYKRPPK